MGILSSLGIKSSKVKFTYCLSCKKDTRNINPKVIKTKNNRKMMLSRCPIRFARIWFG